jgi:hypothetical protein
VEEQNFSPSALLFLFSQQSLARPTDFLSVASSYIGLEGEVAMFTRISSILAGTPVRPAKNNDPDERFFANDPAALAYLRTKPTRRRPSADFGLDLRDIW